MPLTRSVAFGCLSLFLLFAADSIRAGEADASVPVFDAHLHVRNSIADEDGRLLPEWEALVLTHPRRFVIGSDAVWPVEQLDAWDQADTGWDRIGDFLAFHRRWASFLPPKVAAAVLRTNARDLFVSHRSSRDQSRAFGDIAR